MCGVITPACMFAQVGVAPITGDSTHPRLVFISDTQAPIFLERLWLRGNRNTEATRALFQSINASHPSSVFILGDLVSIGAYGAAWKDVDRGVQALRSAGISVHAILGNHEEMLYAPWGEENLQARFPDHDRLGYVCTVDSIAVILLNSNFGVLAEGERAREVRWYEDTLQALDTNAAIRAIVVCCHHSPYSNSKVVGPSAMVQRKFVPPYLAARKAVLFLSGHAHTFERFREGGKDFLVIGGGGGLEHPRYEGTEQRWLDLSPPDKGTMFHYLEVGRTTDTLTAKIMCLTKNFGSSEMRYAVKCGVPRARLSEERQERNN